MNILVIEDDQEMADWIIKCFDESGYSTTHTASGKEGLLLALSEYYDAIILDLTLPEIDGLSIIKKLKRDAISTPILIISGKGDVEDRIQGLQTGADDYLTKPFAIEELIARLQVIFRRGRNGTQITIDVGNLTIDILNNRAIRDGKVLNLNSGEFRLLQYLMQNAGQTISRNMILSNVWDYNFSPSTNVIETRMSRLRDKMDRPFDKQLIHTIHGVGYVLEER